MTFTDDFIEVIHSLNWSEIRTLKGDRLCTHKVMASRATTRVVSMSSRLATSMIYMLK